MSIWTEGDFEMRYALIGLLGLWAGSAAAQQAATPAASGQGKPEQARPASMEEPRAGDHWTWEVHDEITGKLLDSREEVVTEVNATEIAVRFSLVGTTRNALRLYDRSWNLKSTSPWTFNPNDGQGIKAPLKVGAGWTFKSEDKNADNHIVLKRSGTSKVVAQETVTTKAGTFETYKIETSYTSRLANPTVGVNETTVQTWYAPSIDHWVKKLQVTRVDKHLKTQESIELVDYGRKAGGS
ncbi:TapB family protein [Bradyrhizobium sp. HKCCYLS20291]|uniref:TapB family protein n=1 Tax=Bradyrhizobium sp. HKCCYLS20291 TaxID=3420766 RepID=UPI003EBB4DCA